MDTGAYSSNWPVFYTGTTQIGEIRKNAFGGLRGFLEKIVVKTSELLQPCTGHYTQFWRILTKQMAKATDLRRTIRFIIVSEHYSQKTPRRTDKNSSKKAKKMFHAAATPGRKYTDFFAFKPNNPNMIVFFAAPNTSYNLPYICNPDRLWNLQGA